MAGAGFDYRGAVAYPAEALLNLAASLGDGPIGGHSIGSVGPHAG